jgi:hypothetical protein
MEPSNLFQVNKILKKIRSVDFQRKLTIKGVPVCSFFYKHLFNNLKRREIMQMTHRNSILNHLNIGDLEGESLDPDDCDC